MVRECRSHHQVPDDNRDTDAGNSASPHAVSTASTISASEPGTNTRSGMQREAFGPITSTMGSHALTSRRQTIPCRVAV